jgi:hypothetical protein
MIITKEKIIIPTRPEWLVLLSLIGIFSFLGQVTELQPLVIYLGTLKENEYIDFTYHRSSTRNSQPGYSGPI